MKTLKLFLLITITILFFTTCKKYPEGGWSNMAIRHLFGGHKKGSSKTWHIKKYEVNGIDSTIYITPANGYTTFENDEVTFLTTNNKEDVLRTKVYGFSVSFTKGLKDPKIKQKIYFAGGSSRGNIPYSQCINSVCERNIFNPLVPDMYFEWEIAKLTSTEFIIASKTNGNNYKITLNY
jgi:hypothetical protein